MSYSPLVSVLINNYNYGQFIEDAIESVLSQSYKNIELIVVDDGSTDDSKAKIMRFANRVTAIFQHNSGQASAFNAGFAASHGDIIAFLDADDYFLPEKIEKIVSIFSRGAFGWVFHRLHRYNSVAAKTVGYTPKQVEGPCDGRIELRRGHIPIFLPATSGFSFSRETLTRILPMPTGRDITVSDKYLGCMALAMAPGYYSNDVLAVLRLHGSNRYSESAQREANMGRISLATGYWLQKNCPEIGRYADRLVQKGAGILQKNQLYGTQEKLLVEDYLRNRPQKAIFKCRVLAYRLLWSFMYARNQRKK